MPTSVQALVTPTILSWAREQAGYGLEAAARKIPVEPSRLEEWENGEGHPTFAQLRKLANAYKRPVAFFFRETRPALDATIPDFRHLAGAGRESMSPELLLALREARARREVAIELMGELGEQPSKFALSLLTSNDPESAGRLLRQALGLSVDQPLGDPRETLRALRQAAERAGVLVFQARGVDVQEMRGMSLATPPLPVILLNISDAYAARSFSLLHELTHIALNREGICTFDEEGSDHSSRIEQFCNHVAGAALLPRTLLAAQRELAAGDASKLPDDQLRLLARRLGSSPEAVLRRLVILGAVSLTYYKAKRKQFEVEYEQQRSQAPAGFAPPSTLAVAVAGSLYTRLVLDAWAEDRISSSSVSALLGVKLKHVDRIQRALQASAVDLEEGN